MNKFHPVAKDEYLKSVKLEQAPMTYEDLKLPKRATKGSAGYDICSPFRVELYPFDAALIPTGMSVELDADKVCMIFPRSSFGFRYEMVLANSVGVIDSDYYGNPDNGGHIFVKVINRGDKPFRIEKGEAFCQAVILPFVRTEDDDTTAERFGGTGSTDEVVIFSSGCPNCKALENRLKQAGIDFRISTNFDEIEKEGFYSVPVLRTEGKYYGFGRAMEWIKERGK